MTTYVNSINNMTGVVTLSKADIGLGNVDNISLAGIIQSISSVTSVNGLTGTVVLDKSHVGLGNVANASINEIKANITQADIEALGFVPGATGSVSNADTVDGYHASAFALLAGATFLGALATNASTFRIGDTAGAYRVFRNDGYISSNGVTFYKLWHEGNDGSGSGLDADTLDGLHASEIASTGSGTDPLFGRVRIDDDGFNLDVVSGEARVTFNTGGGGAANSFLGFNRTTKNLRYVVDGAQVFNLAGNAYLTLNKITVNEANSFFYRDISIYQVNGDGFIYWNAGKTKYFYSNPAGFSFTHSLSVPQLISTASVGTQPIQVFSTTMVNNLNAQYLGGYQEAAFAKLTGATFSGNVYANAFFGDDGVFVNGVGVGSGGVDSYITYYQPGSRIRRLLIATNTAINQGGWIGLYGDQHASYPGYFRLGAGYQSGASAAVLEGRGDGTLTWKYPTQANPYTVWHSGNDGATSGLDADTVDGIHAEKFARANIDESNPNFTGAGTVMRLWSVAGIGADNMNSFWVGLNNSGSDGVLALYSNYYNLSAFGANMKMYAWNWQTVGDRGVFEIQASNSTDYITLRGTPAGALTWGANAVYHAGNLSTKAQFNAACSDGNFVFAGDAIGNADTLDGLDSTAFLLVGGTAVRATTVASGMADNADDYMNFRVMRNANSSANRDGMYIGYGNAASGATRIYGAGSTAAHIYPDASGNLFRSDGATYWHSANDGAGSGLDADLLDGYHASSFLTFIGQAGSLNDLPIRTHNEYFYSNDSTSNLPVSPSGTNQWWNTLTIGANDRRTQIAAQAYGTGAGAAPQSDIWIRSKHDTNWGAWKRILTSNNLPGTTLDATTLVTNLNADLLDGVQGANYFRTDGTYPNNDWNTIVRGFWHIQSDAANRPDDYYMHRWDWDHLNNGQWVAQFGAPTSGTAHLWYRQIRNYSATAWAKIWTSETDGSGSGLDADLLDGANSDTAATANTIVRRDASGFVNGARFTPSNANGGYVGGDSAGLVLQAGTGQYVLAQGGYFYVANNIQAQHYLTIYHVDQTNAWGANLEAANDYGLLRLSNKASTVRIAIRNDAKISTDGGTNFHQIWHSGYWGAGNTTQVLRSDGWMNGTTGLWFANVLESKVNNGFNAPIVVASTVLCTNLNADRVDGFHAGTATAASTIVVRDASQHVYVGGNLYVSTNNTTGGGIKLADDGDIVDLNDGYCSMRFSSGVRVYSGNASGSTAITLGSNGYVYSSGAYFGTGGGRKVFVYNNTNTYQGFGVDLASGSSYQSNWFSSYGPGGEGSLSLGFWSHGEPGSYIERVKIDSYGRLSVGIGTGDSWIHMSDSDEGQRSIHCNSNRIGFLNSSSGWGAWCEDSGKWGVAGDLYVSGSLDPASPGIVGGNNGMATRDDISNMNTLNVKSGFYLRDNPTNGYYGSWTTWIHAAGHYVGDNYGFQIASGYWDDNLWFRKVTNNSWGGWFKLIRMDSSNRVWISSANPELMLYHTGGTANQRIGRIQMLDGAVHFSIVNDAVSGYFSGGWQMNNAVFFPYQDNTMYCGSSGNRWVAVYAVNGTIQTSDANKKQDIVDTSLGLDFILDAKPKAYRWKSGADNRLHHGLLAQDVAQLIHKYGDFGGLYGTDGLNYAEFIAPLIKAVQELAEEVRQLRKTH